jgi:hypothetical protein
MRKLIVAVLLALCAVSSAQEIRSLHVTKVEAADTNGCDVDTGPECIVNKFKVWGYTDFIEYELSCSEVWKKGESKPKLTCSRMQAGNTYRVLVLPGAIGYPPPPRSDEPPPYSWYVIKSEKEKSK